jgi:hypothetical protein
MRPEPASCFVLGARGVRGLVQSEPLVLAMFYTPGLGRRFSFTHLSPRSRTGGGPFLPCAGAGAEAVYGLAQDQYMHLECMNGPRYRQLYDATSA